MENFYNKIRNFILPIKNKIKIAIASFSKKERIVFLFFLTTLTISSIVLLENVNKSFMISVPREGGNIREGIIGSPRFVNPILAYSSVDNDLVSVIYSGLMRKGSDGKLIPDLAERYEVSKDGLVYTFTLKDKIFFHNGDPVTSSDIIFTINTIKDPIIKSPQKAKWDGVSIDKINEKTIQFSLKQPYVSFLENTTIGILPESLWKDKKNTPIEVNELNTKPIGSGPYKLKSFSKESSGLIKSYKLTYFNKFTLGEPYIRNIIFNFYPNENDLISALQNNEVDQISSITPENADILKEEKYIIKSSTLPRIFGLFFNQNQNQIFTDKKVVEAINLVIDKERIIKEVLFGYGVVIDNPIPENMIIYQKIKENKNIEKEKNITKAQEILAKDGWKKGENGILEKTTTIKKKKNIERLEFSISTGNSMELSKTAELIKQDLKALGMNVEVKTFEMGNLNQSVIRPRKYDALLFGQIVNQETDLFAFWHSTQRNDPGLNIAMYTNAKVDKILEEVSTTTDENLRVKKYIQFESEIKKDIPAVFLYSPNFIYVISKDLKGINMDNINSSSNRFLNVFSWYLKTDEIWKIFAN